MTKDFRISLAPHLKIYCDMKSEPATSSRGLDAALYLFYLNKKKQKNKNIRISLNPQGAYTILGEKDMRHGHFLLVGHVTCMETPMLGGLYGILKYLLWVKT